MGRVGKGFSALAWMISGYRTTVRPLPATTIYGGRNRKIGPFLPFGSPYLRSVVKMFKNLNKAN
ncbi:hypothetical protein V6Z11_A10G106900 [Gossypium hirsutum]